MREIRIKLERYHLHWLGLMWGLLGREDIRSEYEATTKDI